MAILECTRCEMVLSLQAVTQRTHCIRCGSSVEHLAPLRWTHGGLTREHDAPAIAGRVEIDVLRAVRMHAIIV
jgi:hypothetical protein